MTISLTYNGATVELDPDLQWMDEFEWSETEESEERGITGAMIVDIGLKIGGRPITLAPPAENAGWMQRSTLTALQTLEKIPGAIMTLTLHGDSYPVRFRRATGAPIEARQVEFVANPFPGQFGDWYLTTLRLIEV